VWQERRVHAKIARIAGFLWSSGVCLAGCASHATGGVTVSGVGAVAPAAAPAPASSGANSASGSSASVARPNLRALTFVVSAKPPPALGAQYEELARRVPHVAEFFHGAAEGGFGSGFLIVDGEHAAHRFVVTNQHVVELAEHVSVVLDPEQPARDLPVVYVDPDYDLAVVAVTGQSSTNPALGLEFDPAPARDQQAVVASGYPAIGDAPSYQVTRGYVSNEHFVLTRAGRTQNYIQHTAAIDSGSSGGPLTSEAGKLLGVNTLKIRRRENVGLAIPASVVAAAIPRAEAALLRGATPDPPEVARATCEQLLAALVSNDDSLEPVERALGGAFIADAGWPSLDALRTESTSVLEAFTEDPTGALTRASALRLIERARAAKTGDLKTCTPIASGPSAELVSFKVPLGARGTEWAFAWEQGRYKLSHDTSVSKFSTQQILEHLGAVQPPKKKWHPSLR
jgi:serine protease Do